MLPFSIAGLESRMPVNLCAVIEIGVWVGVVAAACALGVTA